MRKSMLVMIAVLLVSALMISCNSDVSEGVSGGDSLAKVTVMSGTSKALTSVVSGSTDVEDLYWYYTATKTDGSLFITGQKTEKTFIGTFTEENSTNIDSTKNHGLKNADLGLFSTGDWTFSFWGYAPVNNAAPTDLTDLEPVYYQEGLATKVSGTTNLTVTLAEGAGMGDATVVFSYTTNNTTTYPYWDYSDAPEGTSLTLYVYNSNPSAVPAPAAVATDTATTNASGHVDFNELSSITLSSGTQTLYFRVMYGTECVGEFDLGLNVKSGTTISVYGLIENLDSTYHVYVRTVNKTTSEATIESGNVGKTIEGNSATSNTDTTKTTVVTSNTPQAANASTAVADTVKTSVTLPSAILEQNSVEVSGNTTTSKTVSHDLTVDVKSEEVSTTAFVIEGNDAGSTAVAGIDLTLVKTTTTTTTETVNNNSVSSTDVSAVEIHSFSSGTDVVYATIDTYISKNLTDVKVRYAGTLATNAAGHVFNESYATAMVGTLGVTDTTDSNSGTGYDPTTGRLVFKTPHFSSFYVISKPVAAVYDGTTFVKNYGSFEDAIYAAISGQTVKLLQDVNFAMIHPEIGRNATDSHTNLQLDLSNLTLDLNGHTISSRNGTVAYAGDNFTIKNGTFNAVSIYANDTVYDTYALFIGREKQAKNAVLENLTLNGGLNVSHGSTVCVRGENTSITGTKYYAVWSQGPSTVTLENGAFTLVSEGEIDTSSYAANPEYVIAVGVGETIPGDENDIGTIIIKGGTYTVPSSVPTKGSETRTAELVNYSGNETKVLILGGSFNSNPTAYVPRGYDITTNGTPAETWTVSKHLSGVAKIVGGDFDGFDLFFDSLPGAITAAYPEETVFLLENVAINAPIFIEKSLILDGANNKITFSSSRGIRVSSSGVSFTLKNTTIEGTNALERAVQVDSDKDNVVLVVDSCTLLHSTYYTVNVCGNCDNLALTINNSSIKGWGAVNLWGNSGTVILKNSTLTGVNDKGFNAEGWNNFGTIILEGDTTGQTDMASSHYNVLIDSCEINAQVETEGNKQWCILFNKPSTHNTVKVSNCTFRDGTNAISITDKRLCCGSKIGNNKLLINGTEWVEPRVNEVGPVGGDDVIDNGD